MKFTATLVFLALGLPAAPALAANDHAGHGAGGGHLVAQADSPLTEGTIRRVDKAAGKVTIAHGPLVNLDMPGMTMVFRVKDPAWLDQFKQGDKIRFMADKVNGAFTVIRYEPAN